MDFRVNVFRKQTTEKRVNQLVQDKNKLIGDKNQLIDDENQLIENKKRLIYSIEGNIKKKENAWRVFGNFESNDGFGRAEVMKITGLSPNAAGMLINKLLNEKLIIPVKGKGKGKYKCDILFDKTRSE